MKSLFFKLRNYHLMIFIGSLLCIGLLMVPVAAGFNVSQVLSGSDNGNLKPLNSIPYRGFSQQSVVNINDSKPLTPVIQGLPKVKSDDLDLFNKVSIANRSTPLLGWKFRSNLKNTGEYPNTEIKPSGKLLWKYNTQGSVRSSPAVVDGVVYVGSDDERVYAIDAYKGTQIWNFTTKGSVRSSPAVVDGIVYIGSDDEWLYAINAETGRQIWKFNGRGAVSSSPTVYNGIVYIGFRDEWFYALDAKTGTKKWSYNAEAAIIDCPAIVNNMVIFGNQKGKIFALDANNGTKIWDYKKSSDSQAYIDNNICIGNYIYYSSDYSPYLRALTFDGTLKTFPYNYRPKSGFAFSDVRLYIHGKRPGGAESCTMGISSKTGGLVWFEDSSESKTSPFAIADRVIYAGFPDQYLHAFDAVNFGKPLWKFNAHGDVRTCPAVVDGIVYFGSDDQNVYAIGDKPEITSIDPAHGIIGEDYRMKIYGNALHPEKVSIVKDSYYLDLNVRYEFFDRIEADVSINSSALIGKYDVIVENKKGKSVLKNAFEVLNPLHASFVADKYEAKTNVLINFVANSTGPVISYQWKFGDGSISNDWKKTSHSYNKPGIYQVSLIIENKYGDKDTSKGKINITGTCPPIVANFTMSPLSGYAPLDVMFEDKSKGDIKSRTWRLGGPKDEWIHINQKTKFNYILKSPGLWNIRLDLVDNCSRGESLFQNITVIKRDPPELLSITPDIGVQGEEADVIISGRNFLKGANVSLNQGANIIQGDDEEVTSNKITTRFFIGEDDPTGSYDLTIKNPDDQSGRLKSAFNVTKPEPTPTITPGPAPIISSINPKTGFQGEEVSVIIKGSNFQNGLETYLKQGDNIMHSSVEEEVKPDEINTAFDINDYDLMGSYDLYVKNPDGKNDILEDAFIVKKPTPTPTPTQTPVSGPVIVSINPAEGMQGSSVEVRITGRNIEDGALITLTQGNSHIKDQGERVGPNEIVTIFDITKDNPTGSYDLSIKNPDGQIGMLETAFTVQKIAPTPTRTPAAGPVISSMNPATGPQGTEIEARISGMNFDEKATVFLKKGENQIFGEESKVSPNEIVTLFQITEDDPVGYYDLYIENLDEPTGMFKSAFQVMAPS